MLEENKTTSTTFNEMMGVKTTKQKVGGAAKTETKGMEAETGFLDQDLKKTWNSTIHSQKSGAYFMLAAGVCIVYKRSSECYFGLKCSRNEPT